LWWFIKDRFSPGVDGALACRGTEDGSLPVGQHEWYLTAPDDRTVATGSASITVSLQ